MAEQRRDERDPWEEFDRLEPAARDGAGGYPGGEPQGFGFRTGVRSARVALGFAVYALVLGSVLVSLGAWYFIGRGQWLWLGLLGLIETGFVLAFLRLVAQARNRRGAA